ncbi:MAG: adenosylcobalamin-dependent ribonucleoside-diphosphate reductase [Parcubacteria group bacterium]|nr:adenosylcobalamin-dependent ribonucleoside-diphosphate reductase [Parcubacteria group bacterium]
MKRSAILEKNGVVVSASQKPVLYQFIKKSEAEKINRSFSDNAIKMMKKRYLLQSAKGNQETPAEMFWRIAWALAGVERKYGRNGGFVQKTAQDFFKIMAGKEFTPAGRTITNAGGDTPVVANCIVLPVMDSMESIFQTLKDAALLQQAGSGLGFDFSHLRPALSPTKKSRGVSSGPVSFLKVYNEAFGMIKQQGRHGANMAMMQVDHPDVLDFIRAKQVEGEIRNFNISVKVTDEFMKALTEKPNEQWYCSWNGLKMKPRRVVRAANGSAERVEELDITPREIFDELVHYAWLNGEPGIVFIDEVNRTNPLPGLGAIDCSNPCGEQFLHHYDNCNLGSVNLAVFVKDGRVEWDHLRRSVKTAVRLMDNVIDTFDFPVPQVTELAQKNRRIGLGIMGFADMLFQLGLGYNSPEGRRLGEKIMKTINDAAHAMSEELAKEKGHFPNLPLSVYAKAKKKLRNAALTTVAPTGSISMMFDCSSGVEPQFALAYIKQDKDGLHYPYFNRYFEAALHQHKLAPSLIAKIKDETVKKGSIQHLADLPATLRQTFVVAMDISAEDHIAMQAAFQKNVDNSISKTINFPNSATKEDVASGFIGAWKQKCKSCTVYRDGSRQVQILNIGGSDKIASPKDLGSGKSAGLEALAIDQERLAPRKRDEVLSGKTYKVKTGYGNLYVTINDDENGLPFEVFAVIGKSGGFFQEQSEGICRMVSFALRAGLKVHEIIDQLKGIRGPMPVITSRGTIFSLPDAIGRVLEEHVNGGVTSPIATIASPEMSVAVPLRPSSAKSYGVAQQGFEEQARSTSSPTGALTASYAERPLADWGMMPGCPDCGSVLRMGEGCMSCPNCGFNRCM